MSHAKRLVVYAGSSWIRIALGFVVAFLLTPMLVGELGLELFGLLSLVSFSLMLSDPIKAAVGKILTREMSQAKGVGDDERLRTVFSNGVVLAVIASVPLAGVIGALAALAPVIFDLSPQNVDRMRLALLAEGILLVTTILLVPANNLYIATHRIVIENAHRTLMRTLDLIAAIVVFSIDTGYPFLAFVMGRVTLRTVHLVIKSWWILSKEPACRMRRSLVSRTEMKELAGVGVWSVGGQVARLGFFVSDQFLLNIFFGLAYNGIYAVVNQLRAYARMFGGNIALGVDAMAADLQSRGEDEKGNRVLLVTMKMAMSVTMHCAILVGAFTIPFIDLWLGKRLRGDESLLAVMSYQDAVGLVTAYILILLPGVVLAETHTAATQNLYGMGHIRKYSPVLIASAGIKIVLATAWLLLGGDPLSLAWSTLIVNAGVYGVYFPWLICRLTTLTTGDLVLRAYARPLAAGAICAVAAVVMSQSVETWTWVTLIGSVGATSVLYALCFPFIVASPPERRAMFKMAGGVRSRLLGRAGAG